MSPRVHEEGILDTQNLHYFLTGEGFAFFRLDKGSSQQQDQEEKRHQEERQEAQYQEHPFIH